MGISIRAYARHRGVTDTSVHKAIRAGRITPEGDGTIDAARADAEWARNSDAPRGGTRSKPVRVALSMTTEDRIREIRRQGLSEFEATEDRKRQVAELQQQARTALAAGEFEQARQLAQKAMDLAAQVASSETSEAKRAEDARKQADQAGTQIAQLEAQSR